MFLLCSPTSCFIRPKVIGQLTAQLCLGQLFVNGSLFHLTKQKNGLGSILIVCIQNILLLTVCIKSRKPSLPVKQAIIRLKMGFFLGKVRLSDIHCSCVFSSCSCSCSLGVLPSAFFKCKACLIGFRSSDGLDHHETFHFFASRQFRLAFEVCSSSLSISTVKRCPKTFGVFG